MAEALILDRYRLLETSGKGAFGTVDVAWDSRLQRRVALKRIPLSVSETDLPGIHEARTAAMLNDARIVTVLDFQVTGTEAIIIMEYVDGPSLNTLLRESANLLGLDVIATIINDVAAALECAHENQVLHLDIKPDNILIDHQGYVKVSDFGLSQLSGTAGFEEPQGGTLGYMPPEQLLQQGVDMRTDLWALATLLYQLLTGKSPFYAASITESLDRIFYEPLQLPSLLRPELDPQLDEIIIQALQADKNERFDSVANFIAQVSFFLKKTQSGRKRLKYLVNERDLDELVKTDDWHQEDASTNGSAQHEHDADSAYDDEFEYNQPGRPLFDHLSKRLQNTLGRFVAALACGSFAGAGLSGFDLLVHHNLQTGLQFILLVGVIALIAFGGFLVPQFGGALASLVFVAGLFARGLIGLAIVLTLLFIIWWLLYGRRNPVETTLLMLVPLLGSLWLGFALPLLAGYFLAPKRAVITASLQGLLLIVMAALTQSTTLAHTGLLVPEQTGVFPAALLDFFATPTPWVMLVVFVLTALVASLITRQKTRWSPLLGAFVATLVLAAGCVAITMFPEASTQAAQLTEPLNSAGFSDFTKLTNLAQEGIGLTLSFILLFLLSLLGVRIKAVWPKEVYSSWE